MGFEIAALAMALEALLGYPDGLVRHIGHPVIWIGRLIAWLDDGLNRPTLPERTRRLRGMAAVAVIVGATVLPTLLLQDLLGLIPFGFLVTGALASSLVAQRSLHDHVARVADALEQAEREGMDLEAARAAVSHIVGRDPQSLDGHGVARAAIESLAENFSDGIVAPVFWIALAGLPGGVGYKAINTSDSMIGHRTERHGAFGWAAARLDDLVNLPASRLSGVLLMAAAATMPGASWRQARLAMQSDARRHRSPNAGWPEAAMAGALRLKLNGPKFYKGVFTEDAHMGNGRREASAADVRRALKLYRRADALLFLLVLAGAGLAVIARS